MKDVIVSLVITILVTVLCFVAIDYLEDTAGQFGGILEKVDQKVDNSDWQGASQELKKFEKKWSENLFLWNLLTEHREIENIEISITHIQSYFGTESKTEAKAEIASLMKYLQHLPDIEQLTIENIF